MNFKYFTSKLPHHVVRRAFEIFFKDYDWAEMKWYEEIHEIILKVIDHNG